MDTIQKNREETAQRRPRPEVELPPSAQQNNGAVRTAEEQRSRAAAAQQETSRQKAAPVKKKPEAKAASRAEAPAKKKAAPKKKSLFPKKAAPKKKRPAAKADTEDISTKKRAYGNSKPKKNILGKEKDENKPRPKKPAPAVIYTQPQAFNRNRLMIQLVTVTAIVVAMVLGISVFFKVKDVTVSGAEVYSEWSVREASGITEGDNLLTFSHARAAAQIKANLPYVDTVRFGIKLPGTVNIIIEEDDVVYAIKDSNGQWWLMNSEGRVVEMGNNNKAASHTQVLGVAIQDPIPNERAMAVEATPVETNAEGETTPAVVTVTGAQRLDAALKILKAMEANDIVGSAASVDVTRLEDIILWYGSRYQVNLGDSNRLDYKIACMNDVILQMSDYQSGILDISFTIWPNQVGYTPFA
ncbi:MAG: FtsQ-type POTRA domain-containing protein [Oscillospiraceae bacterium]|nr:FtsQ-type POTRA domain-containing protein [Oscillospiraceae bacterium]